MQIVCSNAARTKQTLQSMTEAVANFGAAVTEFRGSLYTVAALDGQTRRHLQVSVISVPLICTPPPSPPTPPPVRLI